MVAGSPYAAQALQQLAGKDEGREARLNELRCALAALELERLLSDLPSTSQTNHSDVSCG
jgi:hypothetical protein